MTIVIDNVTKKFISKEKREEIIALENINLTIEDGKFVCFVGPSGCGKTTLLRMIEGFENPTTGKILSDGEEIVKPSHERGFIFQDYSLFPWLNVMDNVLFGLKIAGKPDEENRERARKYLKAVGLEEFETKFPHELSGGMKQRVAIIRSIINDSTILLMDEPYSALDVQTKHKLEEQLVDNWKQKNRTIIFVTHDVEEAVLLADEIVVFSKRPGKIKKVFKNPLPRPRIRSANDFQEFVVEVTSLIDESQDE